MALTDTQRVALAILPKVTAIPSLICSALIVYSIVRDPYKRSRVHHRLLVSFSLVDVSSSFWLFLSTWPIPSEASTMFASGNEATCAVQGFFLQLGIVPSLYNTAIAIYYLLVLRYGWTEQQVLPYEPWMQCLPLLWGFATAIIGIPLRLYNNSNLWCWIAAYPADCQGDDCLRGRDFNRYRWLFYYGPLWAAIAFVTTAMVLIYTHIARESQHHHHETPKDDTNGSNSSSATGNNNNNNNRVTFNLEGSSPHMTEGQTALLVDEASSDHVKQVEHAKRKQLRRTMLIQCAMYTASFYIVFLWLTILRAQQTLNRPVPYWILAAAAFFTPAQGIFNFWTFIFPRFFAARAHAPQAGVWTWLRQAL